MNDLAKELLKNYIISNTSPILVDFLEANNFVDSVVLPANCDLSQLNGHYENIDFCAPDWLRKIENENKKIILVIDKIDSIPKEEQTKFVEILKYRQVSTFKIPDNVIIVVTANKINKDTINEEVYSLLAHIKC